MTIHRAADRFFAEQRGIRTWHSFSAGPHYDPSNVSFGPVVGCDEHMVEPGAGFDWHAHRAVVIVSWVLSGTLRHEDDGDTELNVNAGGVLVQSTGSGIRHRETNASESEPLRFVQTTLLLDLPRTVELPTMPSEIGEVEIDVVRGAKTIGPGHAVVGPSGATFGDLALASGDTLRLSEACDIDARDGCLNLRFEA